MTKYYGALTVGDLIDLLAMYAPDVEILDLTPSTDSYRGYYEHVAIEPGRTWGPQDEHSHTTVGELLAELQGKLGTTMEGYKGGSYVYQAECYVFVAPYGSTGFSLAGFDETVDGKLEPVVVRDTFF